MARPITFLSDYGYGDEFAGVCRAVIARIAPDAQLVDLTHGIGRHDVAAGAASLAAALPYAAPGVHLAVVDPGVGTPRRAVAIATADEGRILVGPDNGLLMVAADRFGGPARAVDVSLSPLRLEPLSATFHGRDVFAPIAAHLANGLPLEQTGEPLDPAELEPCELMRAHLTPDGVEAHVASVDSFGNVALDLDRAALPGTGLKLGERVTAELRGETLELPFALTFADVGEGEPLLHIDSREALALAVNRGSAAERFGLVAGDTVGLRAP